MDPMNSRDILPKYVPEVGWVGWGSNAGVGWVMVGWDGSCRGGMSHTGMG